VAEPTPIAALSEALDALELLWGTTPLLTDARLALERMEAVVKASRAIAALFVNSRGGCWDVVTIRENSDHHHNLRAALVPFGKEGP